MIKISYSLPAFVMGLVLLLSMDSAFADHIIFMVPKATISYRQRITSDMLKPKLFSINPAASVRYVLRPDQADGMEARSMLLPNHPILLSSLKSPILIKEGQQARMVVKNGALQIIAAGIPLQSGAAGDFIKIKNIDSGRIVSGVVCKDGSVSVGVN